jgi:hypothetical protein
VNRSERAWINHPALDWVVAILAIGGYAALVALGSDSLASLDQGARVVFYETAAAVSGALLGFSITAVAIVAALTPGARLQALLTSVGNRVVAVLMRCVVGIALATAIFTLLIVFDGDRTGSAARYLGVGAGALIILRVTRLTFIVGQLLQIAGRDRVAAPDNDEWEAQSVDPADYTIPKSPRSA